jgi:hypothetical protein
MNGPEKRLGMTWQIKRQMLGLEEKKQRRLFNKDDKCHLFYFLFLLWSNFYSSLFLLKLRGMEGNTGIAERQYGTYTAVRVKVLPIANSFLHQFSRQYYGSIMIIYKTGRKQKSAFSRIS